MSTRRLILTALVAGLAILVAGGLQLFRIARSDRTADVLVEGQRVEVAGAMIVEVVSSQLDPGDGGVGERLSVTVEMTPNGSTLPEVPPSAWTLLSGGSLLSPTADSGCGYNADRTNCVLRFAAEPGTQTLALAWQGDQRQWRLAPT